MLVNIFITSALSAAFLPVFTDYLSKNEDQANRLATQILFIFSTFIIIGSVLIASNINWIVPKLYSDFPPEGQILIIGMTKMALLSAFIFALSNTIGNILMSHKHFVSYAISPILYNIGIILGILFLKEDYGIYSAVIGAIMGASLHLTIRLIDLLKTKFRLKHSNKIEKEGLVKIFKLSIPKAISTLSWEANRVITSIVGTQLIVGGFTAYNYARNIQSFAVSIFGISFATAIFPFITDAANAKDHEKYSYYIQKTIQRILFFTIPATVGLILVSEEVISIIFGGGQFDQAAINLTSKILVFFAISIPFESIMHILARAFYAKKNTIKPMLINLTSMTIMALITITVASKHGVQWLSLAFTIAYIAYTIIAAIAIRKEIPDFNVSQFIKKIIKISLSTTVLAITVILVKSLELQSLYKTTAIQVLFGALSYFATAYALKIEEIKSINVIFKKFKR